MLCLVLVAVSGPLPADTVFHYTNVTMNAGHFLLPENTLGAPLVDNNGTPGMGRGGDALHPYDDTYIGGSTTVVGNANAFDRYWFQIYYSQAGYATFDLGGEFSRVYIALSQDHGPYPQEALEYRVWVSNDNVSFTELGGATPITVFQKGWSAAGEGVPGADANGNGVYNDDYSAMWFLPAPYRYVRLTAIQAGGGYDEPEIDAVMGVVPEPGTLLLLGLGSAALARLRRRKS
jgi:hypothetical protein